MYWLNSVPRVLVQKVSEAPEAAEAENRHTTR